MKRTWLLAWGAFCFWATGIGAAEPQGEALLKADILGVFAHPDDETFSAATLAAYARGRGAKVAHVYCTRGEGGGNMVGTQAGLALAILRETELRRCLSRLGVEQCYFLDRLDFGYTESAAVTFQKWEYVETMRRLVRVIRATRPEVVVTIQPAPTPGQHGHHQVAGWLATDACDVAADPDVFRDQLEKEGLRTWRPRKLYYASRGEGAVDIDVGKVIADGKTASQWAAQALSEHRSQAFGDMVQSPWFRRMTNQSFVLVKSAVPWVDRETDLLRGVPIASETPEWQPRPRVGSAVTHPSDLRFQGRTAVENYGKWITRHGIEHVAAQFSPDVVVVAGRASEIRLEMVNRTDAGFNTTLKFDAPPGWVVDPAQAVIRFSAKSTNDLIVEVTPPPGVSKDVEIVASTELTGRPVRVSARLHPVPYLRSPAVVSAPSLEDAVEGSGWKGIASTPIPHTNLWQGSNDSEANCSGVFRVAHDASFLYVEVAVRDDVVVSNIAPNDIKGHWRSDSVELCIDPTPGSEHTFGTYKVGIFPFDSTGKVRAARDADARPGLVEETSPAARFYSRRVDGGYLIRAAIPFAEIGIRPKRSLELGFNVLIYDGDKADAASGENINRARLAWAPRSGVQGRPEDWGRIRLD